MWEYNDLQNTRMGCKIILKPLHFAHCLNTRSGVNSMTGPFPYFQHIPPLTMSILSGNVFWDWPP